MWISLTIMAAMLLTVITRLLPLPAGRADRGNPDDTDTLFDLAGSVSLY
jgi:hypothetical protein